MNPGRMRYRCAVFEPGERSAMGDLVESDLFGTPFHVDVKERDTSEKQDADRLTQARLFEVSARYRPLEHDARVRLWFGPETLDCAVVGVVQLPREGRTNFVLAYES